MRKIIVAFVIAVMLTLSLPAFADDGWMILPENSIIRVLCRDYPTGEQWMATTESRALLASALMMDGCVYEAEFACCTEAVIEGTVYVVFSGEEVAAFFFGDYRSLVIRYDTTGMRTRVMPGPDIAFSRATELLQDGMNEGAFSAYWKVEQGDFIQQLEVVMNVAEILGWAD